MPKPPSPSRPMTWMLLPMKSPRSYLGSAATSSDAEVAPGSAAVGVGAFGMAGPDEGIAAGGGADVGFAGDAGGAGGGAAAGGARTEACTGATGSPDGMSSGRGWAP